MKITWYGHACFRIEGDDGTAIVTDPHTPETSGLHPHVAPAQFVIRSSPSDDFHCNADLVPGHPEVLEALHIAESGPVERNGFRVEAFPTRESLIHKERPADNAMYLIEMDGITVFHLGDLGNPFEEEHLQRLRGNVDVMLVLTGGPPTIELDDLDAAIQEIGPRVVIPMHYQIPKLKLSILPVEAFTSRYPADTVKRIDGPSLEVTRQTLPQDMTVYVLQPEV